MSIKERKKTFLTVAFLSIGYILSQYVFPRWEQREREAVISHAISGLENYYLNCLYPQTKINMFIASDPNCNTPLNTTRELEAVVKVALEDKDHIDALDNISNSAKNGYKERLNRIVSEICKDFPSLTNCGIYFKRL